MASSIVRDLWLPADHAISPREFRFSFRNFLQQFQPLPQRWFGKYEQLTEHIILSSAQGQESYFLKSTLMPTHTHNEATVVAASLRCLAISYEIGQVWRNWTIDHFEFEIVDVRLRDQERNPMGQNAGILPSVDIWKVEDDKELPDSIPQNRERLPQMLRGTLQMALQLLYRGRPQDWPSLFYVLCILSLVHRHIDADLETGATDRAASATSEAFQKLCRLFHQYTGNMQPLNSDFDVNRYAALVDDNELAVEHYGRMHEAWMDTREFTTLQGATIKKQQIMT